MAERQPRVISETYRKRVERRLGGLTYEMALSRGISLQKARGHKPREHVARKERRIRLNLPSDADKKFIKKQTPRWNQVNSAENITKLYMSFPEDFRARLRQAQRYAEQAKKRGGDSWRWDIDGIESGLVPFPPPSTERAMIMYYH